MRTKSTDRDTSCKEATQRQSLVDPSKRHSIPFALSLVALTLEGCSDSQGVPMPEVTRKVTKADIEKLCILDTPGISEYSLAKVRRLGIEISRTYAKDCRFFVLPARNSKYDVSVAYSGGFSGVHNSKKCIIDFVKEAQMDGAPINALAAYWIPSEKNSDDECITEILRLSSVG